MVQICTRFKQDSVTIFDKYLFPINNICFKNKNSVINLSLTYDKLGNLLSSWW